MPHVCGCYYTLPTPYSGPFSPSTPQKHYLPLVSSEAHATIRSTASTTVLKQTFTNPSPTSHIQECTYTFPLYDGVSVVGFTCQIGPKTLIGLVKEKVKAKEIFDNAIARGETAGLLAQSLEASDVFSTKLGNIPAGQSITVQITYIGELKHHDTEGIRFTLPTSIAPRYGPTSTPILLKSPINQTGMKITVDIYMSDECYIKGVQSPSHPIAVSMGTVSTSSAAKPVLRKASATLSLVSAELEKDFVMIVVSKDTGIPKALLETHQTIANHRALMATLVPMFSLPPDRPEIVFVADRSGSMQGPGMALLKSAMKVFLKSMPMGVKFNLCSFGSTSSFLWSLSRDYTSETLDESMAHVETFSANMGGTNTYGAIQATVTKRIHVDLPLEIILLTDGDIQAQNQLFGYVNDQVTISGGKVRVFPLGIGNGVSHSLIEGLARAGNGFAQAVQSGERLDSSVVRMLRGALSPHITDYTLEVKYEQEDDDFEVIEKVTDGMKVLLGDVKNGDDESMETKPKPTISLFNPGVDPEMEDVDMDTTEKPSSIPSPKLLQAPHKIPSLFAFARTTVYLLMSPETIQRNPTSVILRGRSSHGPLALEIPIEVIAEPGQTIHQLAAKKTIQDLEEGRGWIYYAEDQVGVLVKNRYPAVFNELVKQEAVRLGEKFQVAGKWCSFVAVSANDDELSGSATNNNKAVEPENFDSDNKFESLDIDRRYATAAPSWSRSITSNLAQYHPQVYAQLEHNQPAASILPNNSSASGSPQQLQDYQMGLMKLHQQNKNRLSMAPAAEPVVMQNGSFAASRGPREPVIRYISPNIRSGALQSRTAFDTNSSPEQGAFGAKPSLGQQNVTGGLYAANATTPQTGSASLFGATDGMQGRVRHSQRLTSPNPFGNTVGDTSAKQAQLQFQAPMYRRQASLITPDTTPNLEPETNPDVWAESSSAEKVLGLIEIQEFQGSWPANSEMVAAILGFQIPSYMANSKLLLTILVMNFLEVKNKSEEGTWSMIMEKARAWISDQVPDIMELARMERAAFELVSEI